MHSGKGFAKRSSPSLITSVRKPKSVACWQPICLPLTPPWVR
jgi:hypothetical protein